MPKGYRVTIPPPNPSGLCWCECKEVTPLARQSDLKTGNVKGEHIRYIHNHHRYKPERYREEDCGYVTKCWIWLLALDKDGYGELQVDCKQWRAHRYYFIKKFGPIPDEIVPDHLCRIRCCVNPDHMEAVTGEVNTQRGSNAKLTPEIIPRIKAMRANGATYAVLAKHFDVSAMTIHKVISGKGWKNYGAPEAAPRVSDD